MQTNNFTWKCNKGKTEVEWYQFEVSHWRTEPQTLKYLKSVIKKFEKEMSDFIKQKIRVLCLVEDKTVVERGELLNTMENL